MDRRREQSASTLQHKSVPYASYTRQHSISAAIERAFIVDRTMDAEVRKRLISLPGWRGFNNLWMPEDDSEVDYSYINLAVNPERFTGYKARLWRSFCQVISPLGRESTTGMVCNLFPVVLCRYSNSKQSLLCRETCFLQADIGTPFIDHGARRSGDVAG